MNQKPDRPVNGHDRRNAAPQDIEAYFRELIKTARRSDRYALTRLLTVSEQTGLPFREMPLTVAFLEEKIEMYGLHGRPQTFARQMLICLNRLVSSHSEMNFLIYERVADKRVRLLPEADWPIRFRYELSAWKQSVTTQGKLKSEGALTVRMAEVCGNAAVLALSALRLSGVRLSDEGGLLRCLQPEAIAIWEKFLSERQRAKTVQVTFAGVLRIAKDMRAEASCIQFLEARLAALRLTDVAEPDNFLPLIEVPEMLMQRAEESRRHKFSRLAAGRSAVAFQLMWEHPDLSGTDIAGLELKLQIGDSGTELTLLRPEGEARVRLSPTTAWLVTRLLRIYELSSVASVCLLPGRDGHPSEARSAMQLVYHQIQSVLYSPGGSRRCRTI